MIMLITSLIIVHDLSSVSACSMEISASWRSAKSKRLLPARHPDQPRKSRGRMSTVNSLESLTISGTVAYLCAFHWLTSHKGHRVKVNPLLLPPRLITGDRTGNNDETRRADAKGSQADPNRPTRLPSGAGQEGPRSRLFFSAYALGLDSFSC
ncbi:hypothetical protein BDP55DRAFT_272326 [Colletotrichum godetiae]|uniref:Secreted protein n=1 Tax=Colletotrichum godetiae TaxID=1209918 RepID=A0AAJ0AF42_9PEZI|nr:uncharacterized protein BDP55DRAFT_272326 [Colletotrichum godetiae]KAK1672140.1 hypothetical protein BDP55DRAFT_272326 [Colletotrichum godetiae]